MRTTVNLLAFFTFNSQVTYQILYSLLNKINAVV